MTDRLGPLPLAQQRVPSGMADDEALVYAFCIELHRQKRVPDATYAGALALFGEHGVVDLMGINGYYTFLAMVMNGAQTAAPPSSAAPLADQVCAAPGQCALLRGLDAGRTSRHCDCCMFKNYCCIAPTEYPGSGCFFRKVT